MDGLSNLQRQIMRIAGQIDSDDFGISFKRLRRCLYPENPEEFFEDRNYAITGSEKKTRIIDDLEDSIEELMVMGIVRPVETGQGVSLTDKGKSLIS